MDRTSGSKYYEENQKSDAVQEKPTRDSFFRTVKKKWDSSTLFNKWSYAIGSVVFALQIGLIVAFLAANNKDARNTYLFGPEREGGGDRWCKRSTDVEIRSETNTLVITLENGNKKTISRGDIASMRIDNITKARTDLHGGSYTGKPDSIDMELVLSTRNDRKWWRPIGLTESSPPIFLKFRDNEAERAERLIEQLNLAIKQGSIIIDKSELKESAMSSLKERPVRDAIIAKVNDANNKQQWEHGWRAVNGGAKASHQETVFRNPTGAFKLVQGPQQRKTLSA